MAIDLNIEGRHALLFDDDASAAFVDSRAALVPWTGDESLLIDRYDVRHLLDRIPPRSKKLRFVEDTGGVSQSELDRERFLDLPLNNEDEETTERSEATGSGSYQAVPFSYGNNGGLADPNSYGQDHSSYHPPFSVPTSLISNLPPTEKLHQIMARTALFVSEHGGQSEIVLRVKQGNNPTFGFLMPDNQLHPYFRFLVDHPHLLKTDNTQEDKKLEDQESEALSAAGGALSLLGSLYGTGEDDDNTHQQKPEEGEATKPNAVKITKQETLR
ncbi:uncharacterized protein A4U43_C01F3860 [Asparagus officinalis]|uniref:SURP motif domain-containing protein n=1 Tax=Asparagus officinalis TaxID=4686 RepID=A0A5P1FM39_ASPOF|nr:uncharacterized protein A4U43_C01F3860 [Asparagus officinalis]